MRYSTTNSHIIIGFNLSVTVWPKKGKIETRGMDREQGMLLEFKELIPYRTLSIFYCRVVTVDISIIRGCSAFI
ncbi:MAG: hypothetical protein FD188_3446 [Ignavibacteria bacterium]|nr:MAG: hypothetical protein FD188_3446 [Ignavibacteria bacterium]